MMHTLSFDQKIFIYATLKEQKKSMRQGLMPPPIVKPMWWHLLSPEEEQAIVKEMRHIVRESKGMEENDKY